jgi:hypothetical protein
MLKTGYKSALSLVSVFLLVTCIDPYYPKLGGYTSLLVVDGLITDSNNSYIINLSRTFQDQNSNPSKVSDAIMYISDDNGNRSNLINKGNGVYKTDSTQFKGIPGRTYVLHISTNDGQEYESDPCTMYPVSEIDSVYFAKDQQLTNNGTQSLDGISIYLDSKDADNNQYLRWYYEETWKYKVPYPKKFNYVKGADPDIPGFIPVSNIKEFCWNNRRSDEILIRSINNGQTEKIKKQPVFFIPTEKSSRLLYQYTVLVKQYSISKNEYDFWDNLKQVNETGNNIFARQPYSVLSNLHSRTNPKERVLGFFQVSAVSQKRENIIFDEVGYMGLHFYSNDCSAMSMDPSFWNNLCMCPPPTWDDVFRNMSSSAYNYFTEPLYDPTGRILLKVVFTRPECADCEPSGSANEPYFWKDIKWPE